MSNQIYRSLAELEDYHKIVKTRFEWQPIRAFLQSYIPNTKYLDLHLRIENKEVSVLVGINIWLDTNNELLG